MRVPALRRLALLALAGSLLPGCAEREARPSVLLVTLDTTRADRVGAWGDPDARTPVLDAWARAGVIVRDAVADVPLTLPSHATLFTGLPALAHGVRTNSDFALSERAETLAERFAANEWRTEAVVSSRVLDEDTGISQGFERYDASLDSPYRVRNPDRLPAGGTWLPPGERRASAVAARVVERMHEEGGERVFLWAHFYDPHFPYDPPRPWIAALRGDAYRAEIAYVDRELRGPWRWARAAGWITLLVADHGEGLEDHREAEHGIFLYDELVRVPLVVTGEGLPAGRVLDTQVRTADVASTLLALVGLAPLGLGESIAEIARDGGEFPAGALAYCETIKPRVYSGAALKALRTRDAKYVHAPRAEVYDLIADPGERESRASDPRAEVAAWRDRMDRVVEELLAAGPVLATEPRRNDDDLEALRALGYVAGAGSAAPSDELATDGFDPKDLVDVAMAGRDFENGFLAEADRKLDRFFTSSARPAERPELAPLWSLAWQNRAAIALAREEFDRAADAYRESLSAEPANPEARWGLVFALNLAGRPGEAMAQGERLLRGDPGQPKLRLHYGLALALAGRPEAARRELTRAADGSSDPRLSEVARTYADAIGGEAEAGLLQVYLGSQAARPSSD